MSADRETQAQVIEKLERAQQSLVGAIERQSNKLPAFRMSIPARPEEDADLVIGDALRAALSALRAPVSAWQPIETAPKDGTRVLLLIGKSVFVAQWLKEANFAQFKVRPGWQIFDCEDGFYSLAFDDDDGVTHWQPLPSPPVSQKEDGR